ncbi:hypothetical protein [Dictyobacter aurantiacus]|uniref:Uncharacterized protein n=1 Tax=Dictyobacter aurantiacus TaxID=1936993 RepID=A0A401ZQD8_9CHLR|nr:hypothetical protein [Dictyobacter aurantiacus]GCE09030.1 hypothetical protein KDAU_63590 [Dictyobacter aurantiacus]
MKYPFRDFPSPLGARNSRPLGGPPDELDRWLVRWRLGMFKSIYRLRQHRWRVVGVLLILALLVTVWLLPMPDETGAVQTIHNRETTLVTGLQKVCDHPQQVFQQFGYAQAKVPDRNTLSQLPTPAHLQLQKQGDMTYDPATDILCTIGGSGIYTRFVQHLQKW